MQGNQYQALLDAKLTELLSIKSTTDGWNEAKKDKHYTFSTTKYQDNDLKLGRIVGKIPVNHQKAEKYYMESLDAQKSTRDMCDAIELIEVVDKDTYVVLFRTKGKLIVSGREILSAHTRRKLSDTESIVFRANLESHPKAPVNKNAVRGEGKVYAIFLTKLGDNETHVEYYFLVNPKGNVPNAVVNSMMEEQLAILEKDIAQIEKVAL